uniref:Uncharacterized protein n=1 Tax=Biomphalaria glabrata TaxID=6526 RepID=A0A2C9M2T8_BIOGL
DEFDLGFDIDELLDEVEQKAANQIQGCDNKKSTVQSEQGEVSDADEAANNETNVDMKEKQFENKTVKDQQRVKDQENVSEEYNSNVEMQECDRDKEDQTNKLEQSEEIIQERELTLEDKCRLIVDDIRSEEFGVGIKLDEAGQNLMQ